MPVKVFGSPASAEVARVLVCLFEKDIEFQLIRVDSLRPGPKRLLECPMLIPQGEAITFDDGSVTLVESRKILRHVVDKGEYKNQGNTGLFGQGLLERATVEEWLKAEAHKFDDLSTDLILRMSPEQQYFESKLEILRKIREEIMSELSKLLDIYEQRLYNVEYLAGDEFTLADLAHLPKIDAIVSDPRLAHLIKSRMNVSRWWSQISSRQSWKRIKVDLGLL